VSTFSDSLDRLYEAFRDVPKPVHVEGCPCCIEDKDISTLLSKPLREITGKELSSYASSAFLTVGEMEDYLYFLPRIIELTCTEVRWWPDFEVTGRAIGETTPLEWPEPRLHALLEVLHAALGKAIEENDGWTISEWICAIGKMGVEMAPFLDTLSRFPAATLAYFERNSEVFSNGKLGNAFWEENDPGRAEVLAWFRSPVVARILFDAYGFKVETA
jgi:hypothetical protein